MSSSRDLTARPSHSRHGAVVVLAAFALTAGLAAPAEAGHRHGWPGPISERVELLRDDLENGRFDAFTPVPGSSGAFAVVDDGEGNHVARLTDDAEVQIHRYLQDARQEPLGWEDYELRVRARRAVEGEVAFAVRAAPIDAGYWLTNAGDVWTLERERFGAHIVVASTVHPTTADAWFEIAITVRTTAEGARIDAGLDGRPLLGFTDVDPLLSGAVAFRSSGTGAVLELDDLVVTGETDSRHSWTQTTGPPGGWLSDVAVSPSDWRTAYLGTGDGGLFKTTDGGRSWEEVALSHGQWKVRTRNVELAPSNPDVVYLAVEGKGVSPLWRSDDGGASWQWTSAGDIDDHRHAWTDVHAIAVDPTDARHIFVGLGTDGVYESHDGGATLTLLPTAVGEIRAIAVDPSDPSLVLAAPREPSNAAESLIRSTDGGATWVPAAVGLDGRAVTQIHFSVMDPSIVFTVADGFPHRSVDSGSTWERLDEELIAVVAIRSTSSPERVIAAGGAGVFVSEDRGDTWARAAGDVPPVIIAADVGVDEPSVIYAASEAYGIWVSPDLGATWTSSHEGLTAHPIGGLAVDPRNPSVVYAGGIDGVYVSRNFGRTWDMIRRASPQEGLPTTIAVDPGDTDILYAGFGREDGTGMLLKSTDRGATWLDVTGTIGYSVSAIAFDPNDSSTVYAGTGGGPQSGPDGAGLFRSRDGGASWTKLPVPDVSVPAIAVDPTDGDRIVIGTMGHGVLLSTDGGDHFTPMTNGFDATAVSRMIYSLVMSPDRPDVMYAGTHSFYGRIGEASSANALYRTGDGGLTWEKVLRAGEVNLGGGIDTMAFVPGHADWLYVGLHDPGVLFTEDGGTSWEWANFGIIALLTHVYPYRFAMSGDGSILYSGGCGRGVFVNAILDRRDGADRISYW